MQAPTAKCACFINVLLAPPRPMRSVTTPNAKFCSDCGKLLTNLPPGFKGKNPLCKPCLTDRRLMQHFQVTTKAELQEILQAQEEILYPEEEFIKSLDTDALANYLLLMHEPAEPEDDDDPY